jgi:hypothetical protein
MAAGGGATEFPIPEPGKDAFHRVPDFARNEWDAVERVLTMPGGRFMGGEKNSGRCADVRRWSRPVLGLKVRAVNFTQEQLLLESKDEFVVCVG